MGEALLGGVLSNQWAASEEVAVIEPSEARRDELASGYPGVVISSDVLAGVDAIVAVKPQHVAGVAAALGSAEAPRLLSVAAGVTTR